MRSSPARARCHATRRVGTTVAAVVIALAVATVAAQSPPAPDSALEARLRAVRQVRVGHEVRVLLDNGAKLGGRFAGSHDGVLLLQLPPPVGSPPGLVPDTTPYEVPVAAVDSLWDRRPLGPAVPFVGAAAGAVAGFLAVMLVASDEEGNCSSDCWQSSGAGAAVGAALGLVAGVVVGFFVPLWWGRFP